MMFSTYIPKVVFMQDEMRNGPLAIQMIVNSNEIKGDLSINIDKISQQK